MYQAKREWNKIYTEGSNVAYPAEGVIRIFKGQFPTLSLPREHQGLSILDLGCGDGRHLPLLSSLGYKVSATEITDEICGILRKSMSSYGVEAQICTGHAGELPFEKESFDRLLTWNSCYYMSLSGLKFEDHVMEMSRVLKPGGWIIASIPKKSSFIFKDSTSYKPGYRLIQNDYFSGSRNGEVMRCMSDQDDLIESFSPCFSDFCHADLDMQWFGLPYHWHVFCARKKILNNSGDGRGGQGCLQTS